MSIHCYRLELRKRCTGRLVDEMTTWPVRRMQWSRLCNVAVGLRLPDGAVVLDRDAADYRLRLPLHEPQLSARHRARHVPVVLRYHNAGAHDRTRLCQTVQTQEASADAHVQQARCHLSARRTTLLTVTRRRHAQVSYRRRAGDYSIDIISFLL